MSTSYLPSTVGKIGCAIQGRGLSRLCIQRKLANHVCKTSVNFQQPRRFGAKDKKNRTNAQIAAEQERKRAARKRIPLLTIPHVMTARDIVKTTVRTPEQVFLAKALCEKQSFVERDDYPLNTKFQHPLLTCIMKKLGYRVDYIKTASLEMHQNKDIIAKPLTTDISILKSRPPIVAVMGHVDHGKTTILDALRNASVAQNEAGGITQSIGAFSDTVTFIDTPGHSVFTSMRERGAQVTDIVLLVVAADDGVMEQTIESINMIKRAETPVVVAINKCDKHDAAPDLVIDDLQMNGIECEDVGGDVPAVRISALKKIGLQNLIQTIVDTALMHSVHYDPSMQVQGFILESRVQKGLGNVCTVVLKQGTLRVGQILVAGNSMAKVRSIVDASGKTVKSLSSGEAGSVTGWRTLPSAGQIALQADCEAQAKDALKYREKELEVLNAEEIWEQVSEKRDIERRDYENIRATYHTKRKRQAASYQKLLESSKQTLSVPVLNIIIKADVDGSMEAIMKIINSYNCEEECVLNLISYGVGQLKLSEYEHAKELKATIFLFNTDAVKDLDCGEEVTIFKHKIIYNLVNDLREEIGSKLPLVDKDIVKGKADVLEVFQKKKTVIAGCKVTSGVLTVNDVFTITRNGTLVHRGKLSSMRQRATTLSNVTTGNECGIIFEGHVECGIEVGDNIQCLTVEQEPQETSWCPPGF